MRNFRVLVKQLFYGNKIQFQILKLGKNFHSLEVIGSWKCMGSYSSCSSHEFSQKTMTKYLRRPWMLWLWIWQGHEFHDYDSVKPMNSMTMNPKAVEVPWIRTENIMIFMNINIRNVRKGHTVHMSSTEGILHNIYYGCTY